MDERILEIIKKYEISDDDAEIVLDAAAGTPTDYDEIKARAADLSDKYEKLRTRYFERFKNGKPEEKIEEREETESRPNLDVTFDELEKLLEEDEEER